MKILEITLLFLGSVIGAGFATGAEIITFFGHLDIPVWYIALIAGLTIFAVIALEVFLFYPKTNTPNKDTAQNKNWLSKITNIVTLIIYFILFTAMTAGVTSITNPVLAIISLITSALIVLFGFNKLSKINSWLVLIIITLIITTAVPYFFRNTIITNFKLKHLPAGIFWGFLYAGLNCFMFPELIKASAKQQKRKTLLWAGFFTALLITVLVGLILTTIKSCQTTNAAIPLLAAAPNPITISIILLAILTSQYTALFAIIQQSNRIFPKTKNRPSIKMVSICFCTLIASLFGFTQIINFAYPLIGAFTCLFLLFFWLKLLWF